MSTVAAVVSIPRGLTIPKRPPQARATAPRSALAGLTPAAAAAGAGSIALPRRPFSRRERAAQPAGGLGRRLGAFVVSLPDHPWLDRLVRGRGWIPVLGVLLAGIVATQVEILKLGASMGQAIEQTTTLTSQNEQLRQAVSTLGDDRRIEKIASSMGMVLPPPGAVGYLASGPSGNVSGALANIHSPDPSAFVGLTPQDGDGALVTGPGTSTLPPPPGAPVAATSTGTTPSSDAATALDTATASSAAAGSTTAATDNSTQASTGAGQTQGGAGTASQAPATTSQGAATTSQGAGTTSQGGGAAEQAPTDSGQTAPTDQTTQTDQTGAATGAAAIQPSDSSQQSSGG